ncbi:MAG: transglycosylase SLT domain-containing protein [Pseudomonadota bacterium]
MFERARHGLRTLLILIALAGATDALANDDRLQRQRDAFEQVWDDVVDGDWPLDANTRELLKDYPLWPDLRAAHYSAHLQDTPTRELRAFMDASPDLPPIQRLRYRYTEHHIKNARWATFSKLYDAHYANARIAALDCAALAAATQGTIAWSQSRRDALAKKLWLTSRSQHERCDTPFNTLKARGIIDASLIRERMQLAITARRFSLAQYLSESLGNADRERVVRWKRAHQRPEQFLTAAGNITEDNVERLAHATQRIAVRDAPRAYDHWQRIRQRQKTAANAHADVMRTIALAAAQDREPEAAQWLSQVPSDALDQRVLEWRVRAALQLDDWPAVLRAIARMDLAIAAQDRWRYWEATALIRSNQKPAGRALLTALAQERSYHGFLAADALELEYQFDDVPIAADDATINTLAARSDILRVRELLAVGQAARARAELSRAQRTLNDQQLAALARLTHGWSWHPEAIALLGQLKYYDDLAIRFPMAFDELIRAAAKRDQLRDTWVRGIARTESLFQHDAKSAAGAHGLMQLLPSTAKQQAKNSGFPWRGTASLRDAPTNIQLGSAHLASLNKRFDHAALATAAYNAGAHRVERWIRDVESMPAEIWIESIAYDETRRYVERVLFAEVVFTWRQGKPVTRLSRHLKPIGANLSLVGAASRLYSEAVSSDSNQ